MAITSDRNDPGLSKVGPDGMQETYLVLPEDQRDEAHLIRPVRDTYKHLVCGATTTMNHAIAQTYASRPNYYRGTYCASCRDHYPVGPIENGGQFEWLDGEAVGT